MLCTGSAARQPKPRNFRWRSTGGTLGRTNAEEQRSPFVLFILLPFCLPEVLLIPLATIDACCRLSAADDYAAAPLPRCCYTPLSLIFMIFRSAATLIPFARCVFTADATVAHAATLRIMRALSRCVRRERCYSRKACKGNASEMSDVARGDGDGGDSC